MSDDLRIVGLSAVVWPAQCSAQMATMLYNDDNRYHSKMEELQVQSELQHEATDVSREIGQQVT
jgi:hypothetical protein